MRENCTYGSMRGRAYPAGASCSTLHPSLPYGANDLAAGFDRDPIPDESVEYFTGDPSFNLVTASNDTVTQTAVATLNSSVTAKFFKAEIGIFTPYEPEDPWEPEPEDPEPEEPEE